MAIVHPRNVLVVLTTIRIGKLNGYLSNMAIFADHKNNSGRKGAMCHSPNSKRTKHPDSLGAPPHPLKHFYQLSGGKRLEHYPVSPQSIELLASQLRHRDSESKSRFLNIISVLIRVARCGLYILLAPKQ